MARGGNTNWQMRIAQWMQGRYGIDEMTQALIIVGCALTVINFIFGIPFVSLLSLAAFVWGIFRCYSKNYSTRARELEKYQEVRRAYQRERPGDHC